MTLLDKAQDAGERAWYANAALEHGWSRNILVHQIDSGLYQRQGQAITNFDATLPPAQSDLAQQLLKDPYSFDFLTLGSDAHKRDLEHGLLQHLRDLRAPLGVATYRLTEALPKELRGSLPTIEELEGTLKPLAGAEQEHAEDRTPGRRNGAPTAGTRLAE